VGLKSIGPAEPTQARLPTTLSAGAARRVNKAFVRNVVVGDMRNMRTCETPGFTRFLHVLQTLTQAAHAWRPPVHYTQAAIIALDMATLRQRIRDFIRPLDPNSVNLHWDLWEDRQKRQWCGAYFFKLDPSTWQPMNILVAFDMVSGWTGADAGHGQLLY